MGDVTMAARYSPQDVEERLMQEWLDRSAFHAVAQPGRRSYSIVIPPPNVTGSLHMGHALNSTIQDLLTRYHHMRGENALWLVGMDHAGIATQNKVEAQLLAEEGLHKWDLGRTEFERRVWEWKRKYGSTIIRQLKRLGCACDYERERFTMDEAYQKAVQRVFVELYEKGDIYRDVYLVNWCTRCGSAISDLEVEHVERTDQLYYVKYRVIGEDDYLTVATTRPETILGDTAVAVNPKDPRYGRYVGKKALVPLVDREVPIIADEYVDIEFGTGALKITPGHDPNDWEIGQRHGLPAMSVIGPDGRMNEDAGEFEGMSVEEARAAAVMKLDELGLFVRADDYGHSVGSCYRCGTVIEPLLSLQWFMDMTRLAVPAVDCVADGRVRFVPERWGPVYLNWMEGIRPWCISRQLWWGHRLPVYYCDGCGKVIVASEAPAMCSDCGGPLRQDEDVLDTWFSSALWPFATLGWPEKTQELAAFYPTSVLSTARDIIYLWVARMIMMGLEFMGDVPFHEVIIHPTIMAADGRRMSKSLGTGVDPLDLIEEYGADATRFGLAYMSSLQDVRFSNERIEMGRNFANKIWNAARLILQGADPDASAGVTRATAADRWIFSRLSSVIGEVTSCYERYDFSEAARLLYRFIWNELCDWYLEVAKARLYGDVAGERMAVSGNLLVLLEEVVLLLHPLMPFLTEEVYRNLPQVRSGERPASAFDAAFPEAVPDWAERDAERAMEAFMTVVSGLRSARDELEVPREVIGKVHLVGDDSALADAIVGQPVSFKQLAGCEVVGRSLPDAPLPAGRHATISTPGLKALLDLTGLVDVEKERERLLSRAKKARAEAAKAQAKLGNQGFLAKAPPEVVQEERDRLERAQSLLDEITRQYQERVGEALPA